MKIRGILYRLARLLGDWDAISSGSPKALLNRGKNKVIGKKLNKVWRWPL